MLICKPLALNVDGFVGKPLTNNPSDDRRQVWKGQMTNGDWIIGFFNRETTTETRSIDFMNDLGISGSVFVRDLLLNVMTEMINS